MKALFFRRLAYGLVAFGFLAGGATPLQAGPLPAPQLQSPTTANAVTTVRDSWAGEGPAGQRWRRHNRDWRNGDNRGWRSDRDWRHNRHWRGDWERPRWRDNYRWRHRDREYFGLGFGLGMVPSYNYRYVQPRRTYRSLSRAHVEWCLDRYRTYRPSDNTYVPRRGVRAICRSPFD